MSTPIIKSIMENAHDKACALKRERQERPSGLHADDCRVATEIVTHQFELGKTAKALRDQNERWKAGIAENAATLEEIEHIHAELQIELNIANHRPVTDL